MDEAGKTCEYCHRFIRKDEDGNIYCKAHGMDIPLGCTDHLFDVHKFNELHRTPTLDELVGGDE